MPRTSSRRIVPGISIQAPWVDLILRGAKTIETRTYPLPSQYVGVEMAIIETPGRHGKFKRRISGLITFAESFRYGTSAEFYRDHRSHHVAPDSQFGWPKETNKSKWGWPITSVRRLNQELPPDFRAGILFSRKVPIDDSK